jgi:hypothetical protein
MANSTLRLSRRLAVTAAVVIATALLLFTAAAPAAPTTATVRVEGSTSTVFEERAFATDTRTVPVGGCSGGATRLEIPGATALGILDDAANAGGFAYDTQSFMPGQGGVFVCSIAGETGTSNTFWLYKVNNASPEVGAGVFALSPGDRVLWYFTGDFNARTLDLVGPVRATTGETVSVQVTAYDSAGQGLPATGATVSATGPAGAGSSTASAGADGRATFSFASPGIHTLKANRSGDVRSNAIAICIYVPGSGACDTAGAQAPGLPGALGAPGAGGSLGGGGRVRDSKAPVARISGPRNGRTYRRGPRLLRGTATDAESGVGEVKLSLRRHVRGRSCRWWSGRRERFAGGSCRKRFFFAVGDDPDWSYLLPRRLSPGHYVVDVKVSDRAGNRDEQFERGSDRAVFDVLNRAGRLVGPPGLRGRVARVSSAPRPRATTHARSRAETAARAARVKVMVAGRTKMVASAREVRARPERIRASARRCLVGASTPLAALVKRLRLAGVSYHVRDFGRCSPRRSGSSAQLFVDRIDGESNRGQNGWFYKVNHRAGTSGAADPSGLPDGRLRTGDRVLWFYCVFETEAQSCQQSLEVIPSTQVGRTGDKLRVRVLGYRNEGGGVPVAGATVTLGPASVVTDASGRAELVLPGPRRHLLSAAKQGAVPSFPVPVRVL